MTFLRSFFITLLAIFLLTAAFLTGYWVRDRQASARLPILAQAYDLLLQRGLKPPPPPPALEYGMIRGMLQAYGDPFTSFIEPVQHELQSNALHGSYGGIGVSLDKDLEGYWILYPFPESPAAVAGVQEGDRLISIEDQVIGLNTPSETIQSAIRGPIGNPIQLEIGRPPDFSPLAVSIRRAEIPLPSVFGHLAPGEPRLGVLEINLIAASTADEIQRAVASLHGRGATHFVLDLRDNPGGLLTAGVDIARLFLREGIVIQQQYKGQGVETYEVEHPGPLVELPLAVMINGGSASAAEIIAGSLQAQDRAQVIGSPSLGKDSIQLVFELSDGSSLHITSAQWWVPGQEDILGGIGLQPDIAIAPVAADSNLSTGPDPAVQAAAQALLGIP